jgi:hypothetical protein
LRKIAENCDFASITPDEILRDRLYDTRRPESGYYEKVNSDEICHAAERMAAQMKVVEDGSPGAGVNAVKQQRLTAQLRKYSWSFAHV